MSAPLMRVADLAEQIRGVSYDKAESSVASLPGTVPILRAGNITDEGLTYEDLVFVPANRISEKQKIQKNDVVIAASSGSIDVVGKAARAIENVVCSFGAFCKVLRPNSNVDPAYFAHYFKTTTYRKIVSSLATGININNLRNEHLDEIKIPIPSLYEQRRIAEVLDRAEALRAKRRAALAQLDTLTQAIFLDMFGDPETNRKKWPVYLVGDVADVQGGLQVTSARKNCPCEVPYLRVANVFRGYLDLSEIKTIRATNSEIERTALIKDDLLVVEGHGNPLEIGRCALWDGSITGCVHQNHIIRVRLQIEKVDPIYVREYLNSAKGRQYLLKAGKTTSGLNTISVSEVRKTPLILPSIELQHRFSRRIIAIESHKTIHNKSLAGIDALFASLQHRAFRGEL